MSERVQLLLAAALVALVTFVVFAPANRGGVLNWDDVPYLDAASHLPLPRLLTTFVGGNYHPLTMLSMALELRIAPRNIALQHLTNVLLHAATAVLLLVLLLRLTSSLAGATIGALLWSVHPLRVESVAWLVERKDVLYATFYVAALLAYLAYVRGRRRAIIWAFALFLVSLLAKVSAITFPGAMVAIDFIEQRTPNRRVILEKLPFVSGSLVFGLIGLAAHSVLPKTMPGFTLPLAERLVLSFRALVLYLGNTLVPLNLSAFYAYPPHLGLTEWSALPVTLGLALLALASLRRTRAVVFALGFFTFTIAIALPVFPTGWVVAADRYTYIPSIGLAYLAAVAVERWQAARLVAIVAIVGLSIATYSRIAIWHDSVTLWSSVIAYDDGVSMAYNARGAALAEAGLNGPARADFDRAIALEPCYELAFRNRGLLSFREGRRADAQSDLQRARACEGTLRATR